MFKLSDAPDAPVFPQQRKLMGSSVQNSSSVHWCRRRVRFNKVPENVPKVPVKVWEKVPENVWEALVQATLGGLGSKPSQVQQGCGEGSGEGSGECWGNFVAERRQVQQGSGQGSGEGLSAESGCRARSGSTGFRRRFHRKLGGFGAEPGQVQQAKSSLCDNLRTDHMTS